MGDRARSASITAAPTTCSRSSRRHWGSSRRRPACSCRLRSAPPVAARPRRSPPGAPSASSTPRRPTRPTCSPRASSASTTWPSARTSTSFGLSLSRQLGGLSLGAELSYRHNMPLLADAVPVLDAGGAGAAQAAAGHGVADHGAVTTDDLPESGTPSTVGDTMHGLVNLLGIVAARRGCGTRPAGPRNSPGCSGSTSTNGGSCSRVATATASSTRCRRTTSASASTSRRPGSRCSRASTCWRRCRGRRASPATRRSPRAARRARGSFGIGIARRHPPEVPLRPQVRRLLRRLRQGSRQRRRPRSPTFNGTNSILSDRDFIALTFKTTF